MWAPMWPYWLMVLFQRFWRWLTAISRAEWLMADEPSSLGEVVMLGAVSIERRELVYCYIRKSTTFAPPWRGPSPQTAEIIIFADGYVTTE